MVDRTGIEPVLQACKARVPPTTPTAHIFKHTVANACIEAHLFKSHQWEVPSVGRYASIRYLFTHLGYRPRLTIR